MKRKGRKKERKLDHDMVKWGEPKEGEKDNDEIPFSSAGPVVALGLTRLRVMEDEREGGGKRQRCERRQKVGRVTPKRQTRTKATFVWR